MDEDSNIIVLNDEKGRAVKFELLDLIEYNSKAYVVLLPIGDNEVVILEIEDTNDEEESYVSVENEDILNEVFEKFKERVGDMFDFVD